MSLMEVKMVGAQILTQCHSNADYVDDVEDFIATDDSDDEARRPVKRKRCPIPASQASVRSNPGAG